MTKIISSVFQSFCVDWPVSPEFQLDYDDSQFFENVLRNLNGRTKKEMSMLGQVSWLGLTNWKIMMIFWFRVSTDPYGRQPPPWSMPIIAGTGIRSVRRIPYLFQLIFPPPSPSPSPSPSPAPVSLYFSRGGGLQNAGNLHFFVDPLRCTFSFWKKFLKFYSSPIIVQGAWMFI